MALNLHVIMDSVWPPTNTLNFAIRRWKRVWSFPQTSSKNKKMNFNKLNSLAHMARHFHHRNLAYALRTFFSGPFGSFGRIVITQFGTFFSNPSLPKTESSFETLISAI
ncbi:hypothetical protein RF11_14689 [Thelohanellus kitauei]|uniref:Uncharacterized protein n=1 Tax=Thelohanellus kitauei TaxID=669202 RepID=A0A0C2JNY4_THEKT|nr:hypothetical protein RF11_14689 [Thelohanellus kitauei]